MGSEKESVKGHLVYVPQFPRLLILYGKHVDVVVHMLWLVEFMLQSEVTGVGLGATGCGQVRAQRLAPTSTVSWHEGYGNSGPPGMDSTTIDKCVCGGGGTSNGIKFILFTQEKFHVFIYCKN